MKTITSGMEDRLVGPVTTLCRVLTITPKVGDPVYLTDLDSDCLYNGQVYRRNSFDSSSIRTGVNGPSSDVDVTVLFDGAELSFVKTYGGVLYGAALAIEVVSFDDDGSIPEVGIPVFVGIVSTISMPTDQGAILTGSGSGRTNRRPLTEEYSSTCRADFGDARCKVDLDPFTETFTVYAAYNRQQFQSDDVDEPDNTYNQGVVVWTSGANVGLAIEVVRSKDTGAVDLLMRLPFAIEVGDTGTIIRGCAKTVAACTGYDNLPNMRAEPYVPGEGILTEPVKVY